MVNKLTHKQQNDIKQVAATMEIEQMSLTKQCYENLTDIACGKKTTQQVITEIIDTAKQKMVTVLFKCSSLKKQILKIKICYLIHG